MAVYAWKFGMKVPAQKAGECLEELESKHGALTPEIVLEESRDEKATLHPCFEWDNEKAAEGYRLYQAGQLLRNITIVIERDETPKQITRAFVNISDNSAKEKGNFVSLSVAMSNDEYKAQVLKNARYELQTFKNKYAQYKELKKIFAAIDELEKDLLG